MSIVLSSDQAEIQDVARSVLSKVSPLTEVQSFVDGDNELDAAVWREIAELGWLGVAAPVEFGGLGYGVVERCLLLEELGRFATPAPFLSSAVLATDLIAAVAPPDQAAALLGPLLDGTARASVVVRGDLHAGSRLAGEVTASRTGDGYVLSGPGGLVLGGDTADLLVVVATIADGIGVFVLDASAPGADRSPERTIDGTRPVGTVTLDNARAQRLSRGPDATPVVELALDRATVALAAEMVGGAARCLHLTLEYAKAREQFGVPIGSFQAVKHRLATLAVRIDGARESVYLAAEVQDGEELAAVASTASAASVAASDAHLLAATEAIQLHGAIGFTWEHPAHLYYKRALVSAQILGSVIDHQGRVARHLGV